MNFIASSNIVIKLSPVSKAQTKILNPVNFFNIRTKNTSELVTMRKFISKRRPDLLRSYF